jgi:hypothetical protein
MSDIFLSYDDLDRDRIRLLVETLEARGWSVWWDHEISAGDSFSLVIERELEAAQCVIVAWTRTSVESDWVRAEANEAWKRGKLVPVLLDRVTPPMPFGQIHAADLVDWDREGHPGFAKFIADLQRRMGKAPVPVKTPAPTWFNRKSTATAGGAALVLLVAAGYYAAGLRPEHQAAVAEEAEASLSRAGEPLRPSAGDTRGEVGPRAGIAALAGHWQAPVTYPDGATFEERFTFQILDGQLSGTASLRGYGNRRGIQDGAVANGRLSFRTTGQVQLDLFTVRRVAYRYEGVPEGEGIRFTVVEEGSGDPGFSFTAHRITAEQANRIATGGTRPRLSGMSTNGLYPLDHVREVITSVQRAIARCYAAAEFDEVNHEFVNYDLTMSGGGSVEQMEMRPEVSSLEPCMRRALGGVEWGRTATGEGGTLQLSIDARLPWNP